MNHQHKTAKYSEIVSVLQENKYNDIDMEETTDKDTVLE